MSKRFNMTYHELQTAVYENKVKKEFNVSDVSKEIILLTEEFGELCDAYLGKNHEGMVDAVGDIMVYSLGLSAMFGWDADKIISDDVRSQENQTLGDYLPYVGREIGMIAKTFKKSNKKAVREIDNRIQFQMHTGKLMWYCSSMFDCLGVDKSSVLEKIVKDNASRTHQGKI